jgi:hypothetical protein
MPTLKFLAATFMVPVLILSVLAAAVAGMVHCLG